MNMNGMYGFSNNMISPMIGASMGNFMGGVDYGCFGLMGGSQGLLGMPWSGYGGYGGLVGSSLYGQGMMNPYLMSNSLGGAMNNFSMGGYGNAALSGISGIPGILGDNGYSAMTPPNYLSGAYGNAAGLSSFYGAGLDPTGSKYNAAIAAALGGTGTGTSKGSGNSALAALTGGTASSSGASGKTANGGGTGSVTGGGAKEVYDYMKQFKYQCYYGDVKSRAKTIQEGRGNCVDLTNVAAQKFVEKGYKVKAVRGFTKGGIEHQWLEYLDNGKWKVFDASHLASGGDPSQVKGGLKSVKWKREGDIGN